MFKLISLGALAFSPVAIANQQTITNQNQSRTYPKIFDDVFESFFTASDSPFDVKKTSYWNNNKKAFEDFQKMPMYESWKNGFGTFLNNLDESSPYDVAATLFAIKQDKDNSWQKNLKFKDYANFIERAIKKLPYGPNRDNIEKQKNSLPFIGKVLNQQSSKASFYQKMLKRILSDYNKIPSDLMRNNLWDLKTQIESSTGNSSWNHNSIQFKDFLKSINDKGYDIRNLNDLFRGSFPQYSKDNIKQFLDNLKYVNKGKYKELLEKFDDILNKNWKVEDLDNIIRNISPDEINSIIKNQDIFKKLGSNAPTMNNIQKGLTIAGGFGTLLISFFTAALALKLIHIKSSKRAVALSSAGTITLFGTGVALIIMAFI